MGRTNVNNASGVFRKTDGRYDIRLFMNQDVGAIQRYFVNQKTGTTENFTKSLPGDFVDNGKSISYGFVQGDPGSCEYGFFQTPPGEVHSTYVSDKALAGIINNGCRIRGDLDLYAGVQDNDIIGVKVTNSSYTNMYMHFYLKVDGTELALIIAGIDEADGLQIDKKIVLYENIMSAPNLSLKNISITMGFVHCSRYSLQNYFYCEAKIPQLGINDYYYYAMDDEFIWDGAGDKFSDILPTSIEFLGNTYNDARDYSCSFVIDRFYFAPAIMYKIFGGDISIMYGATNSLGTEFADYKVRSAPEQFPDFTGRLVEINAISSSNALISETESYICDSSATLNPSQPVVYKVEPGTVFEIVEAGIFDDYHQTKLINKYYDFVNGDISIELDAYYDNTSFIMDDEYFLDGSGFDFEIKCVKDGVILEDKCENIYQCPEFVVKNVAETNRPVRWGFEDPTFVDHIFYGYDEARTVRNSRAVYDENTNTLFFLTVNCQDATFSNMSLVLNRYDCTNYSLLTTTTIANGSTIPISYWCEQNLKVDPYYSFNICFGEKIYRKNVDTNQVEYGRNIYIFWTSSVYDKKKILYKYSQDNGESWSSVFTIDFTEFLSKDKDNMTTIADFGVDCINGKLCFAVHYSSGWSRDNSSDGYQYLETYIIEEPLQEDNIIPKKYSRIYPDKDFALFSGEKPAYLATPSYAIPKIWSDKMRGELWLTFTNVSSLGSGTGFVYVSKNGYTWTPMFIPDAREEANLQDASSEYIVGPENFVTFDVTRGTSVADLSVLRDENGFLHIVAETKNNKNFIYYRLAPKYVATLSRFATNRMQAKYVDSFDIDISNEDAGFIVPMLFTNVNYWDLIYKQAESKNDNIEVFRLWNSDFAFYVQGLDPREYGCMGPYLTKHRDQMFLSFTCAYQDPDFEQGDGQDSLDGNFAYIAKSMRSALRGARYPWLYGANTSSLYHYCNNNTIYPGFSMTTDVDYNVGNTGINPTNNLSDYYVELKPSAFRYLHPIDSEPTDFLDDIRGNIHAGGLKFKISFRHSVFGESDNVSFYFHIANFSGGYYSYGCLDFKVVFNPALGKITIVDNVTTNESEFTFADSINSEDFLNSFEVYVRVKNDLQNIGTEDCEVFVCYEYEDNENGSSNYLFDLQRQTGQTSGSRPMPIIGYANLQLVRDTDNPLWALETYCRVGFFSDDGFSASNNIDELAIFIGRKDVEGFLDPEGDLELTNESQDLVGVPVSSKKARFTLRNVSEDYTTYNSPFTPISERTFWVNGKTAKNLDVVSYKYLWSTSLSNFGSLFREAGLTINNTGSFSDGSISIASNSKSLFANYLAINDTNILCFKIQMNVTLDDLSQYEYTKDYSLLFSLCIYSSFDLSTHRLIVYGNEDLLSKVVQGMYILRISQSESSNYAIGKILFCNRLETLTDDAYSNQAFELILESDYPNSFDLGFNFSDFDLGVEDSTTCFIFSNNIVVNLSEIKEETERYYEQSIRTIDNIQIMWDYDLEYIRQMFFNSSIFDSSVSIPTTDTCNRYPDNISFKNIFLCSRRSYNEKIVESSNAVFPISMSEQLTKTGGAAFTYYPIMLRRFALSFSNLTSREVIELNGDIAKRNSINQYIVSFIGNPLSAIPCVLSSPPSIQTQQATQEGGQSYDATLELSEVASYDVIETEEEE